MLRNLAIMLLSAFILTACGPIYNTTYHYIPPENIQAKQCIVQCSQAKSMCDQACSMRNSQCEMQARDSARFAYEEYRQQRVKQGKNVERTLSDFYSGYGCNQDCGCGPQYNQCYTLCGGKITEERKCIAFCDQAG